jgi:hypothetical protein
MLPDVPATRPLCLAPLILVLMSLMPIAANAQATDGKSMKPDGIAIGLTAAPDAPITNSERTEWMIDGTIGSMSLGVGVIADAWETGFDRPREWGPGADGWTRRYMEREADVAISSSIEAGLGSIWGEDPRYLPSKREGFWPRVRYAMKTVVLAPRRDGRLAPAWGRFAGNVVNNVIENTWLPPSITTPAQTAVRSVDGLAGRLLGNLWDEFWPEVRQRLHKP